ncbi:methylglyoxal synthase [Alistipes sp. ZOR0009]|jgi:methylglyoxal synthase|uniref:methylglyoxal synthase n=1 Tax=Alistipes sp. ZOR0009 TaxID=1339253 RepID=UPI000648D9A1|nr:methylglyoxal synthase [Alistipes sp. ZOR0009]
MRKMLVQKRIALVAHDNCKKDMIQWVEKNSERLVGHDLICTGTTGRMIEDSLRHKYGDEAIDKVSITCLKSGPLGGDQQLGSLIAEGKIDVLIFFWDAMHAQPHDVDVKALLRIASVYNIPTAQNRSTADFIVTSPILEQEYTPKVYDYSNYISRKIDL